MKAKTDVSGLVVNTDTMATLLGFTRQRINQLAKEGILEKQAAGRFPLMKNIQRYIEYLKSGQKPEEEEHAAKYWEEKALHEKAKRELAELRLARLRGQLHDAADVELVLTNMLATFRNRVLAIPQKVAPKVIGMNNLAEINETINVELLDALTELSEYDPIMFAGGEVIEEEDGDTVSEGIEIGSASTEVDS